MESLRSDGHSDAEWRHESSCKECGDRIDSPTPGEVERCPECALRHSQELAFKGLCELVLQSCEDRVLPLALSALASVLASKDVRFRLMTKGARK